MIRTRLALPAAALAAALALTGCGGSGTEPAAAPTSAPASAASIPSPTTSPSHTPTLPTEMTDDGGSCISKGKCGYYVAGKSCKGVEWCEPADLVEPGMWQTAGGTEPTDCMWGLSEPPKYELTAGGYATTTTPVYVRAGSVFNTKNCRPGWRWVGP